MSRNLEIAREIATKAHAGQFRFDGVTPYIKHPESVANSFGEGMDGLKTVAWLHDVLEDTSLTAQALLDAGIDPWYVNAVVALTKRPEEDYDVYLARVKANDMARKVKIADILDNLGDSPTRNMVKKYVKGLKALLDIL